MAAVDRAAAVRQVVAEAADGDARCVAFLPQCRRSMRRMLSISGYSRGTTIAPSAAVHVVAEAVDWFFMIAGPMVTAVIVFRATRPSRK